MYILFNNMNAFFDALILIHDFCLRNVAEIFFKTIVLHIFVESYDCIFSGIF